MPAQVFAEISPEFGQVVGAAEAVSSLELERSVFGSADIEILSAAFEKARAYVESDPSLGILNAGERQSELARCLMALLKLGNSNPVSMANSAIALLRKNHSRALPTQLVRARRYEHRVSAAR
jgi:hypothetical protein